MRKRTGEERRWENLYSGRGLEEGTIPESEQKRRQYAIEDTFEDEDIPFITRYFRVPDSKGGDE